MTSNLLTTRRFAPLFWCQFFSAFNDNFLKNSLGFLIVYHAVRSSSDSGALVQLAKVASGTWSPVVGDLM